MMLFLIINLLTASDGSNFFPALTTAAGKYSYKNKAFAPCLSPPVEYDFTSF